MTFTIFIQKKILQYGIKKREEKEAELKKQQEEKMGLAGAESGINRRKKTPEEIAAEQAEANQDDLTSKLTWHNFMLIESMN